MKSDPQTDAGVPPASKPAYRRRKFVVKRAFQFKYALIMFALFGLAAFMVWWEIYNSFNSLVNQALVQDPAAVRMIDDVTRVVLLKVVLALGLVWFLSLLLSHYLAGPIYRFEACLKQLKDGDLVHRARLRPHDELKTLAAAYNETVESLQLRFSALRDAAKGVDGKSGDRLRSLLADLKL